MRVARLIAVLLCFFAVELQAAPGGRSELLEIRNTILNLVDALVEQGVLSAEKAEQLKREARAKAAADAGKEGAIPSSSEQLEPPRSASKGGAQVVRVPYVPEFVKDEIRAEVRKELREEVLSDVAVKAREEHWGTPDALPEWINRLTWSGDFRLRFQSNFFDDDNPRPGDPNAPLNFHAINDDQQLLNNPDVFLNYSEDFERVRARLRLGLDAEVLDSLMVGVRLSTGNLNAPTSLNETLGNNFNRHVLGIDRMYMRWDLANSRDTASLSLVGGRFERPFYATEMVWDNDIAFDGFAGQARFKLGDSLRRGFDRHETAAFLNIGIFPIDLDETLRDDGSSNDKWLFGGQLGLDYRIQRDIGTRVAFAVYDYTNIVGRLNRDTLVYNPGVTPDNRLDWTAPGALGTGNTLFPIKFDSTNPFPPPILFGLASDYTLANLTAEINFTHFDPVDVQLGADLVKNIGFDADAVSRRTGFEVDERTLGYAAHFQIGHAELNKFGDWRVSFEYKYVQRDAVLDAYSDSNFLLGGTNAEGYIFAAHLGLSPRTFLRLRYFSADTIDGYNDNLVPGRDDTHVGADVLQVDLSALF